MTAFVTILREEGLTSATIARQLRTLKLATRWANKHGLLLKVPEFTMPSEAKGSKGRALSLEEFERMLAKAGPLDYYLRGLWTSGLRLAESLQLRWDDAPGALVADFTGRRPMLRIPAESEKGNCHRLLPMAPEFAELLESVPENERRGHVFRFPRRLPADRPCGLPEGCLDREGGRRRHQAPEQGRREQQANQPMRVGPRPTAKLRLPLVAPGDAGCIEGTDEARVD